MHHQAKPLEYYDFDCADCPLATLPDLSQKKYLLSYLRGNGARRIILEPHYFDRDFLAEFAAFYSVSARGYGNVCRRLHFFDDDTIDEHLVLCALSDDDQAATRLQRSYLGFVVLRPLQSAPFGRTVLRHYPQGEHQSARIDTPSREYTCHLSGLPLKVTGLAWQQQDRGVSACATIGVWTLLHSSAFDDVHAIPTTADITRAAHKNSSLGRRPFPQSGLRIEQLLEAIIEYDLAPVITNPDIQTPLGGFFSKARFAATCAAYIRSGYPVAVVGNYCNATTNEGHLVCLTSFREERQLNAPAKLVLMDSMAEIFYMHDDNWGPGVRCVLQAHPIPFHTTEGLQTTEVAKLVTTPPAGLPAPEPSVAVEFVPTMIIAATHNQVNVTPHMFQQIAITIAKNIKAFIDQTLPGSNIQISYGTRFIKLAEYLSNELKRIFVDEPSLLGLTRKRLLEETHPMSLHIGLLRILIDGTLSMDVLYDTTDSDLNRMAFTHLVFDKGLKTLLDQIDQEMRCQMLGQETIAFA